MISAPSKSGPKRDGSGFQPFIRLNSGTWGVAPGWYEGAPLALGNSGGEAPGSQEEAPVR